MSLPAVYCDTCLITYLRKLSGTTTRGLALPSCIVIRPSAVSLINGGKLALGFLTDLCL